VVYRAREHFEAPNWSQDNRYFYYNGGGKLWRIPVEGGTPVHIPTGNVRLNNDHGLSPDGRWMAISGQREPGGSQIFIVPIEGGEPELVVAPKPSYWHGWSPDGKLHAYCAERNKNYDIYVAPARGGGEEIRLTTAEGLDDGPEYSPDGKYIYFNSERSGLMRIWRMNADGSDQQMISQGPPSGDWFAHPSPDGKWIVYLSYDASVKGHPANKGVVLKVAKPSGDDARVFVTLFGGQGTINVPSWSPDSKHVAFVSYRLVKGN
jgi:TolB protein